MISMYRNAGNPHRIFTFGPFTFLPSVAATTSERSATPLQLVRVDGELYCRGRALSDLYDGTVFAFERRFAHHFHTLLVRSFHLNHARGRVLVHSEEQVILKVQELHVPTNIKENRN